MLGLGTRSDLCTVLYIITRQERTRDPPHSSPHPDYYTLYIMNQWCFESAILYRREPKAPLLPTGLSKSLQVLLKTPAASAT